MNNCKAFLDFFDELLERLSLSTEDIPENVESFYNFLKNQQEGYIEKPILTEVGVQILDYMQANNKSLKAKDIADGMSTNSRKISGALRKLVSDGFVDKFGQNPVIYSLTSKGEGFNIIDYKESLNKVSK